MTALTLATALIENGHLLVDWLGQAGMGVESWRDWSRAHGWAGALLYLVVYVGAAMAGLPIHAVFAVYAGLAYPLAIALPLAWTARGLGDAAGFLAARYLLRHRLIRSSRPLIARFRRAVAEHGLFYLFLARLLPGVPSPVVNAAMAVSDTPFWRFVAVSTAGVTVWTGIFVYAGSQLSAWRDPSQLVSRPILWLMLTAALLLIVARSLHRTRKRRASRAAAARAENID